MHICPLCNGLIQYERNCSKCGAPMEVLDRIENYYDNYSPYLSYNITDMNDGDPFDICTHVLVCRNCNNKEILRIKNIVK